MSLKTGYFLRLIYGSTALLLSGCTTTLNVKSEPSGAQVLWSPTGVDDWRPWPPRTWNAVANPEEREPVITPYKDTASFSDTVWITVEKEGYYRPLPQVAQLYSLKHQKLEFALEETPELEKQRLLAQGFVPYKGNYVKPEELGLVEYNGVWMLKAEAELQQKRDAGLILYQEKWVTPAERDRLYAADQQALGFIEFKGRWVKPEVQAKELEVDKVVQQILAEPTRPLRTPRVVGSLDQDLAQLQVHNSSRFPIRVYLSGSRSDELILNAYETYGTAQGERFTLIPGEYQIAVKTENPVFDPATVRVAAADQGTSGTTVVNEEVLGEVAILPSVTTHAFSGGFQYLITFELNAQEDSGKLREYERKVPSLPEGLPTIVIPEFKQPEQPQGPPGAPGAAGGRPGGGRPSGGRPGGGRPR